MSKIQWTDVTDNVIVVVDESGKQVGWHCTKHSPGCKNCYAEAINQGGPWGGTGLAYRKRAGGTLPEQYRLHLRRDIMEKWPRQRKRKKHFVASMTDVFGEFVPDEWVFEILDHMSSAHGQIFQVLTKRAERLYHTTMAWLEARNLDRVPDHIMMMVSVENQEWAEKRIPWLLRTPSSHGLSVEPLLGPLDLELLSVPEELACDWCGGIIEERHDCYAPRIGIDWVIVGGESGPNARKMKLEWVRKIVSQCRVASIPVFVKQLGARASDEENGIAGALLDVPPEAEHLVSCRLQDMKGGDPDEWPPDMRVRQFPKGFSAIPSVPK